MRQERQRRRRRQQHEVGLEQREKAYMLPSFDGSKIQHRNLQQQCFWTTQRGQTLEGPTELDRGGSAVALTPDGATVAFGSEVYGSDGVRGRGHVAVYRWLGDDSDKWTLTGGGAIVGESTFDYAGDRHQVALSDDGLTVAVGAGNDVGFGSVRVFRIPVDDGSGQWTQLGSTMRGVAGGDRFGGAVALSGDGNRLIVGASRSDGPAGEDYGFVRVLDYDGVDWTLVGDTIEGTTRGKRFGFSVSISRDGNTIAVGAPGIFAGADPTRVYSFSNGGWVQLGSDITNGDPSALGDFGFSLQLSRDNDSHLIVGSPRYNDNALEASRIGRTQVFVFEAASGDWTQVGKSLYGDNANDEFGYSVAINDDASIVAIGTSTAFYGVTGYVRIYQLDNNQEQWKIVGETLESDTGSAGDYFGTTIALSGDGEILAVGAYGYDGTNGEDCGRVQVFQASTGCGFGSSETNAPTTAPQSPSPVTEPTTSSPTKEATLRPTTAAPQSPSPVGEPPTTSPVEEVSPQPTTDTPTILPAEGGLPVQETFSGVTISFVGATEMDFREIPIFETVTEEWFIEYYDKLQSASVDIQDVTTRITLTKQTVSMDANSVSTNTVLYNQRLSYIAFEGAQSPENYITLPYLDGGANRDYVARLTSSLDAFPADTVQPTVSLPIIQSNQAASSDGEGSPIGLIAGICVGLAALALLLAFGIIRWLRKRGTAVPPSSQQTPSVRQNAEEGSDVTPTNPVASPVDTVIAQEVFPAQETVIVEEVVPVSDAPVRGTKQSDEGLLLPRYKDQVQDAAPRRTIEAHRRRADPPANTS